MKTRARGARGDPASWRLELGEPAHTPHRGGRGQGAHGHPALWRPELGEPAGTAMGRTLHGDSAVTQLFLMLHSTLQFRKCLHSHPFRWGHLMCACCHKLLHPGSRLRSGRCVCVSECMATQVLFIWRGCAAVFPAADLLAPRSLRQNEGRTGTGAAAGLSRNEDAFI